MIAIVVANAIAIMLVYQFIKRLPKTEKIIFIAACIAIAYALVSIVYWISGFGIESEIHEATKNFIIYTFVPVNIILLAPSIASKYNKLKLGETSKEKFIKRITSIGIIAIIILIIEGFYFRGMQNNVIKTINTKNQTTNEIEATNTIDDTNIIEDTANMLGIENEEIL
jgi:ACR3 family arsenite efflux pump ArsB